MLILVSITNCGALLPTLNQPKTISLSWQGAYQIQYCSAEKEGQHSIFFIFFRPKFITKLHRGGGVSWDPNFVLHDKWTAPIYHFHAKLGFEGRFPRDLPYLDIFAKVTALRAGV